MGACAALAMLLGMPATLRHRSRLVGFALALFGVAFAAMLLLDVPPLGIAYFLYLPIALVALATSPLSGAATGIAAAEIFFLGESLGRHTLGPEVISTTAALRLLTYASIGALIGKFAEDHRLFAARLRMLAERDPLTGLLNARAHEAAVAQRIAGERPFALVLIDMDWLKEVNDSAGHAAGNEALKLLANAVAGAVRRDDTVARIGGDEFAVLLGEAGAREAGVLCERLDEILGSKGLSASFGWAAWPDDAADARALFERADERLYGRKAERRAPRAAAAGQPVPAESLG
jgi:diguanylate cyclase (GGDEF)-like protein